MTLADLLPPVLDALRGPCRVRAGDRGLLAVSGGADSTALLELLRLAAPALDLHLAVATVDHGLRPESAGEARSVLERCGLAGLPARALAVDVRGLAGRRGSGLEEAARLARYEALEAERQRASAAWIALGHSLDDQAETLVQRLHRGTGLDGLGAMAPRSGVLVRPLLGLRRADLRRALASASIPWAEDPTNQERRFERVAVRLDVMPGLDAERAAALAAEARGLAALLRPGEEAWVARRARRVGPGIASLRLGPPAPGALLARALRGLVAELRPWAHPLDRAASAQLASVVAGERAEAHLQGLVVARGGGNAVVALRSALPPGPASALAFGAAGRRRDPGLRATVVVGDGPVSPVWGTVPAGRELELRGPRPGDTTGGRLVAHGIARRGVPRALRPWVPVVVADGEVLWTALRPDRQIRGPVASLCLDRDHPLRQWLAAGA